MSQYLVTVRETYEHTYLIEADSAEEAEMICAEESGGCDLTEEVETEYDSELVEDEEDLDGISYDVI